MSPVPTTFPKEVYLNKILLRASVAGVATVPFLAAVAGATPAVPDASDSVTSIATNGGPEVGAVLVAAATASVAIGVLQLGVRKGWKAMFGRGGR